MYKNIKLSHYPAIKICPFVDPGISCIFCILAVTEQGFADNATLLSCNATLPAFTYSSRFFHLPVFFTGKTYALLGMFMPLPYPASDLTP